MPLAPALKEKKRICRTIERLLRKNIGQPRRYPHKDPLDVLIQTILSQNTSDKNSHRAFLTLKRRFKTWESARKAGAAVIEDAIRIGGLAHTKAARIQDILSTIHSEWGEISLRFLCGMNTEKAAALLGAFHGVGLKTINCVLLFGCGQDVFPVDTHILRVSKRLGLIGEAESSGRAHREWAQMAPRGRCYSLHINLIEHGRRVCRARNPRCPSCCLADLCAYYQRKAVTNASLTPSVQQN
ncbi:MAG: endonuclease III [Candidatus Abyssobacteria bacterium SURF_5]|uniref:Endonuclease III n=1 Tax=Abyssobacteria bacterium (strain SURF_5) TaxID=2093360 RepID=A0A3A4NPQ1_ABYX5|nr:MAG: endonuclease III [Candidatus Abyssubacteria bacterium SURF_5]